MNWYLKVIRQYCDFEGRSRRKEYWMFTLFNVIFSVVSGMIFGFLSVVLSFPTLVLGGQLYTLFILIPNLAVTVRRAHDCDFRGWWILVPFFNLFLLFFDSTEGPNRFGPDPKATERGTSREALT